MTKFDRPATRHEIALTLTALGCMAIAAATGVLAYVYANPFIPTN